MKMSELEEIDKSLKYNEDDEDFVSKNGYWIEDDLDTGKICSITIFCQKWIVKISLNMKGLIIITNNSRSIRKYFILNWLNHHNKKCHIRYLSDVAFFTYKISVPLKTHSTPT